MDRGRTRYQITEETEQSDGSVFVRVRKQYNDKADVSKYVNWHQTGLNLIRRVCDRNCHKITFILSCSMLYYKQKICDKEGEQMTIDLALEKMIPGMQEIYGDLVDSIILYGSTARGTRAEDTDVDVAILLRAGATKTMRDQMLDLVVDLELECGRVLSVLCIDYDKFAEWKDILPFYKNIRKDGVVLWQAA